MIIIRVIFVKGKTNLFREKKSLKERFKIHCGWKIITIGLTLITLGLSSLIGYLGGKK